MPKVIVKSGLSRSVRINGTVDKIVELAKLKKDRELKAEVARYTFSSDFFYQPVPNTRCSTTPTSAIQTYSDSDVGAVARENVRVSLGSLERDTMGKTWFQALEPEFEKPYFHKVCHSSGQLYNLATKFFPCFHS